MKIKQHAEETGQLEGELCNRDGCKGIIEEHEVENCSCHIDPPCSACTTPREYCPECDWQATDDEVPFNGYLVRPANPTAAWAEYRPRPLDPTKIDYRVKHHTSSSQKCEGVAPYGTTPEEIVARCNGTFGGRFASFSKGTQETCVRFTFIAYTD